MLPLIAYIGFTRLVGVDVMSNFRRRIAFHIVVLLGALALPVAAPGQSPAGTAATPADAANKLVAALAKGDVAGAAAYAAAADRTRCIALLQASDRLMESRARFQQTVTSMLEESPQTSAFLAHIKPQHLDHIVIVAVRNADTDTADLDVRSFGSENRTPPNVSTWHAVRESGQWRIHLPPCTSDQAMAPLMNQYQGLITAIDVVNASVQRGQVTSFSDARIMLLRAERVALAVHGARQ